MPLLTCSQSYISTCIVIIIKEVVRKSLSYGDFTKTRKKRSLQSVFDPNTDPESRSYYYAVKKVRQDIQDNLAIANALLAKSPSKSARKRVGGRSLQFDEDKTPVKSSKVKDSCDKKAGGSAIEDNNDDIVPIKEPVMNNVNKLKVYFS